MPLDTKILSSKIKRLKEVFESGRFADALFTALNAGNGMMQQRIFTENQDTEGSSFGTYVGAKRPARPQPGNKRSKAVQGQFLTSYQRKRALAGRQTARKDLEFTGTLRRSIETVVEGDRAAVLQFNALQAAKVARGQEQQITNIRNGRSGTTTGSDAVKIFGFNERERQFVAEEGTRLITQILKP